MNNTILTPADLDADVLRSNLLHRAEWRQHRARTRTWSLTPLCAYKKADLQRWRSIWQVAFETATLQTVREAASKHIQIIDARLEAVMDHWLGNDQAAGHGCPQALPV